MTLADLILKGLEQKGLTKVDLADALDLDTPNSVSKWTSDTRRDPVPWRHWRRICQVLGIGWATWYRTAKKELPKHVQAYEHFLRSVGPDRH